MAMRSNKQKKSYDGCSSNRLRALMVVLLILVPSISFIDATAQTVGINEFHRTADKIHVPAFLIGGEQSLETPKSKSRAVLYSLISTAAPVGAGLLADGDFGIFLISAGITVGPTAGIAYADDLNRAALGMGIRSGGGGLAAIGLLLNMIETIAGDEGLTAGNVLIFSGLSMTGISMMYDIFFESRYAVERYNENLRQEEIELNPWINPSLGAAGLSLKVGF